MGSWIWSASRFGSPGALTFVKHSVMGGGNIALTKQPRAMVTERCHVGGYTMSGVDARASIRLSLPCLEPDRSHDALRSTVVYSACAPPLPIWSRRDFMSKLSLICLMRPL